MYEEEHTSVEQTIGPLNDEELEENMKVSVRRQCYKTVVYISYCIECR